MTLFQTLPAELVLKVASHCQSMPCLLALARTCRAAHALLLSEPDYAAYAEGSVKLTTHALRSAALSGQRATLGRVRSLHLVEPSIVDDAGSDDDDDKQDSDYASDQSDDGETEDDKQNDNKQARSPLPPPAVVDRRDSACAIDLSHESMTCRLVPTVPNYPNPSATPLATWSLPVLHATFSATPCLTRLDLSRTSLTSAALHVLLPLVPRVAHLSIAQCPGITAAAARTLAAHPTPFRSLDVSWTRIHGALALVLDAGVLDKVHTLRLVGLIGVPGAALVERVAPTICELDVGYSAGVTGRDLIALAKRVKRCGPSARKVKVMVDQSLGGGGRVDAYVVQQVRVCSDDMVHVSGCVPMEAGSVDAQPPARTASTGTWSWNKVAPAMSRTEAVFAAPRMAVAVYMSRRGGGGTGLASPAV